MPMLTLPSHTNARLHQFQILCRILLRSFVDDKRFLRSQPPFYYDPHYLLGLILVLQLILQHHCYGSDTSFAVDITTPLLCYPTIFATLFCLYYI